MMEGPITYEQLFDILRREKSRDELQMLEKTFYDHVRAFLAAKEDVLREEGGKGSVLATQRASIEYQNARKILRELYDRRERKIVTMALHRTRTDAALVDNSALLPEERLFLESLVHLMVQTREQVLSSVEMRTPIIVTPMIGIRREPMQGPDIRDDEHPTFAVTSREIVQDASVGAEQGDTFSATAYEPQDGVRVRFLAPVPKFVGKDLHVLGPFDEGQVAVLPEDIAQILIRKGRAQEQDE